MKKLIIFFLLIASASFGQVLHEPKGLMRYWEYENPICKDCPILIFLPGSGERSDTPNLSLAQKQGTPKLLKQAGLNYLEGFTFLLVQQVTNKGYQGDPNNPDIIKFLAYVHETYKTENVFVTGLSLGGDGSWFASYLGTVPLVKAIAPVSCKGDYNGGKLTQQRGIKAFAIHGISDTSVPPADGKRPINGMNSVGGNAQFTLIPGAHDSRCWDVAFSLTDRAELGGTTIYKWFLTMVTKPPVEIPGIYIDGEFCGETECVLDGHTITIKN